MNLIKNKNDYASIWWSKISISSLLQLIILIFLITFSILTVQTFAQFGWGINSPDYDAPDAITPDAQIIRGLFVYSLVFYLAISAYIQFRLIPKNKDEAFKGLSFFGIIAWVFVPYFFKIARQNQYLKEYFLYLRSDIDSQLNLTVSHSHFFWVLNNKVKKDKLFQNTALFYFTFLIALISFILVMIPSPYDQYKTSNLFLFDELGYFTNTTNIFCFLFLLFMMFSPKNNIFKNNTILILTSAYITIVTLIYWCFLVWTLDIFATKTVTQNTITIWTHTVLPIAFVWFSISSIRTNLYKPIKFRTFLLSGFVYPAIYGTPLYILPFFVRFTPYGILTNPNPQMIHFWTENNGDIKTIAGQGTYWAFTAVFLLAGLLILFFFIYYFIAKNIVKKYSNNIVDISKTVLYTKTDI